ncbi:tubulin folding cofactor B isoform X2 [Wolffia australiana]
MGSRLQIPANDSIILRITHSNLKTFSDEVRFWGDATIAAVKDKLWKKCGTSVESMRLELYDHSGIKISDLSDDSKPLGYRLHIVDLDPSSLTSGGWLEDTSLVQKYTISDEAYNKLGGNFRKFREKLAGSGSVTSGKKLPDNYMEEFCSNIKVGDRCEIEAGEKRGVVRFVGKAETLTPGFWVGIELDEPLGKHDGMVKGKRYFQCQPQHGLIVRPDKVKVGDFPEKDPFDEEI